MTASHELDVASTAMGVPMTAHAVIVGLQIRISAKSGRARQVLPDHIRIYRGRAGGGGREDFLKNKRGNNEASPTFASQVFSGQRHGYSDSNNIR